MNLSCILVLVLIVVLGGGAALVVRGIARERGEEYGIKLRE